MGSLLQRFMHGGACACWRFLCLMGVLLLDVVPFAKWVHARGLLLLDGESAAEAHAWGYFCLRGVLLLDGVGLLLLDGEVAEEVHAWGCFCLMEVLLLDGGAFA
eukprot:1158488-Pelagomonas_calceolata.AAC.2